LTGPRPPGGGPRGGGGSINSRDSDCIKYIYFCKHAPSVYTCNCKHGIIVNMSKVISIRVSDEERADLEAIAAYFKESLSKTAHEAIQSTIETEKGVGGCLHEEPNEKKKEG